MGGRGTGISRAEAASALGWWLESGVDIAVQEEPRNWVKPDMSPADSERTAVQSNATEQQIPETLDLFRDWLARNEALPLAGKKARRILPKGAQSAQIMLLADSPDSDDAAADQPIGGQAWDLTQRMLEAIGLSAEEAYCANISCFNAPGTRLKPNELEECATIARRHVALVRPKRLLLLGDGPSLALLGKPVAAARGHVHTIEGVRTVATFHPRFLINQPSSKGLAWKDLLLLMEDQR